VGILGWLVPVPASFPSAAQHTRPFRSICHHANKKTKSPPSEEYALRHCITIGLRSLARSVQTHLLSFAVHNSRPCSDAGLPQRMFDQLEPARSTPRLSMSACGQRCATPSSFRSGELMFAYAWQPMKGKQHRPSINYHLARLGKTLKD
jgi:hypothetical protein